MISGCIDWLEYELLPDSIFRIAAPFLGGSTRLIGTDPIPIQVVRDCLAYLSTAHPDLIPTNPKSLRALMHSHDVKIDSVEALLQYPALKNAILGDPELRRTAFRFIKTPELASEFLEMDSALLTSAHVELLFRSNALAEQFGLIVPPPRRRSPYRDLKEAVKRRNFIVALTLSRLGAKLNFHQIHDFIQSVLHLPQNVSFFLTRLTCLTGLT